MKSHSLYIHIPFCRHICSYCDFNTYAGLEELIPAYINALCSEIEAAGNLTKGKLPIHTIFIGGGTPSILPVLELQKIFRTIYQVFEINGEIETTLEANPGRLGFDYLKSLRELGINRLSLGMQSAVPEELLLLARQHDFKQTAQAVNDIRRAGFENFNLDLIFGIPDQSLENWQTSLELALSLDPDHFSLYSLSIEQGTPLNDWLANGLVSEPDSDLAADMYELASKILEDRGYQQYEISNWARGDADLGLLFCQHNLQYWRNLPYLGFGAGAHGYAAGKRTVNVRKPKRYIERLLKWQNANSPNDLSFPSSPASASVIPINREEEIKETMMMGLRLTQEGVSKYDFNSRFETNLEEVYEEEIDELLGLQLLEWDPSTEKRLRLTRRGRLLGNQVFSRFI